jgi:hypothetical protein
MARQGAIGILLVAAILAAPRSAKAWDREREGFVLGLGSGVGGNLFSRSLEDWSRVTVSVAADFKVGYAPSSRWQLYYFQKFSILEPWRVVGIVQDLWQDYSVLAMFVTPFVPIALSELLTGVGVTQYEKPEAPSIFYSGGAGVYLPFPHAFGDSPDDSATPGPGLFAEIGYEHKRHRQVAVTLMWGHPRHLDASIVSVLVTYDLVGY